MNDTIEKKLDAIAFYQRHPEYKPFIGEQFDKFRVLQVGESHYVNIGQTPETENDFSLQYFADNWWNSHCDKLFNQPDGDPETKYWGSWYTTRDVIGRFLIHNQKNYSIFMNMIRVLNEVVKELPKCDNERLTYHYFAFMNFFQMPALYKGVSFEKSLSKAEKGMADPTAVYKRTVEESCKVLNDVINILQPNVIVFTSKAAYYAYCNHEGEMAEKDGRIIKAVHPCCSWWNRKHGKDQKTGKERLVEQLRSVYGSK
jgi:hypothetical protein